MYKLRKDSNTLTVDFESRLDYIDRVVLDLSYFVLKKGDFNRVPLEQVIRELVSNAVIHGNILDSNKNVTVTLKAFAGSRFQLIVVDEGFGLSQSDLVMGGEKPQKYIGQKGLALVHHFADEVLTDPATGTVSLYITLSPDFEWGLIQSDEKLLISPSREITSDTLHEFRSILFGWLKSDVPDCELCLVNSREMSSEILSVMILFSVYLKRSPKANSFRLTGVSPELMTLFTISHMISLFNINHKYQYA
ncbi:MAG: ATP-binding protein [Fibrobacterales bacterium]